MRWIEIIQYDYTIYFAKKQKFIEFNYSNFFKNLSRNNNLLTISSPEKLDIIFEFDDKSLKYFELLDSNFFTEF